MRRQMVQLVAALACVAIVGALFFCVRDRPTRKPATDPRPPPQERLVAYLRQKREYKVFVGLRDGPKWQWIAASNELGETIQLENGNRLSVADIRSFIVAYPSGEILDAEALFRPLPPGVFWAKNAADTGFGEEAPSDDSLREGASLIAISFGRSSSRPNDANYYSTHLTNKSNERLSIRKFGAFSVRGGRMQLNTITGGFFSAQQFIEWYEVQGDGWIRPGETVSDPNNYGAKETLWVYYVETESGKAFVAGKRPSQDL